MRIRRYAKRRYYSLLLLLTMSVVQSLGSLIHPLPSEQRKEVRDLEKVTLRRCKTECSLLFNSTCVNEKLVPNYTKKDFYATEPDESYFLHAVNLKQCIFLGWPQLNIYFQF